MIPQDYSISLSEASKTDSKTIFNIKLTEELVEKLMKGQQDLNNLKGIEFCISEQSNKLIIGSECFQFMKVKETQPVHLLSNHSSNALNLLGDVSHKLNPKLELEASKAEAIRQRSQEAEKERLARKTVELDVLPVVGNNSKGQQQKRLITRRPSITSNSSSRSTSAYNSINSFPLKTRIIQILAIGPIQIDQLIQKLNTNSGVLRPFLNELCLDPLKSGDLQLRPELFSEVKLSDWPFYSLRERDQVSRNIATISTSYATPPETPEMPSPKKQIYSANFVTRTSAPASAKKTTTAKDRLSAIMKRRRS